MLVVNGSGFGEKPGTRHIRIVFLPPEPVLGSAYEAMTEFIRERYSQFQFRFLVSSFSERGQNAAGSIRTHHEAMVDIHCHILPGIDDGSKSWEMTAEMCRLAVEDGITHIVATPHCNDRYEYNRERFTEMLGQLHDAANGELSFSLGCDFHFSYDNIQDALENPRRYTIGDSQYLLIEFSDFGIPPSVNAGRLHDRQPGHGAHHHPSRT